MKPMFIDNPDTNPDLCPRIAVLAVETQAEMYLLTEMLEGSSHPFAKSLLEEINVATAKGEF